jgi:putative glycosyltransferase
MFRSENYLREFYARIAQVAEQLTSDFEVIFVNDGSPDKSLDTALQLYHEYPEHIVVVDLSRNFGHHKAMMTGLMHAQGDYIFLLDSDLEEPPEVLPDFYSTIQDHDVDVVFGYQEARQDPFFNRLASSLQYRIVNSLSAHPIPPNLMTIRLMTRRFVEHLLEFREQTFVISMLWEMTGFKSFGVPILKKYKGKSSYSFWRKISYFISTITTTSYKPLTYIVILGLFITVIAAFLITYIVCRYFIWGIDLDGWTSLILSIWFLGGLNMLALGVIGIYISVIFSEVKARPYTIVRHIYRQSPVETLLKEEIYAEST